MQLLSDHSCIRAGLHRTVSRCPPLLVASLVKLVVTHCFYMSLKAEVRVVLVGVLCLLALATLTQAATITSMCIRNCGQCKEMYGDYFHGQACAESCIMTQGVSIPDCNNPATFNRFLKRFI